ncbi:MAG: gamma carbonic anhydrase family protein [Candidatus Eremiobacteraeota bacterium]|nr:gamma carbonic anhydrase family protein [Candidatus Eremiobacteraeota bacterium]
MIVSSGMKKPKIHASAYVASSAVLSGDVTVEEGCAILHGAVLTAEGAPIEIGANTVIMENAVLKSSGGSALSFPLSVGESCIVGPAAYLVGCTIEPGAFVAASVKVLNGATVESGVSVAIGGIVHIGTRVAAGTHVPMGHLAHGDPAEVYSPDRAPEVHARMQFFQDVFNLPNTDDVRAKAAETYAKFLRKTHAQDAAVLEPVKKTAPKGAALGRTRDEPPPTQAAEVEKVVDVMFLELQDAQQRREQGKKRHS